MSLSITDLNTFKESLKLLEKYKDDSGLRTDVAQVGLAFLALRGPSLVPGETQINDRLPPYQLGPNGTLPLVGVSSGNLQNLIDDLFSKYPTHTNDPSKPVCKIFTGNFAALSSDGSNNWRNALDSQTGLRCSLDPSNPQQLADPAFLAQPRQTCVHRDMNDRKCNLRNAPCFNPAKKGGTGLVVGSKESPKLNVEINGLRFHLSFINHSIEGLVPDPNQRLPFGPLAVALYSGAASTKLKPQNPFRVSIDDIKSTFFGSNPGQMSLLIDVDPQNPYNKEFYKLSEVGTLVSLHQWMKAKGFLIAEDLLANIFLSLKTKPFLLLAGVTGTGKSWIVRLLGEALALGQGKDLQACFQAIHVRPSWSDPQDLLGYLDLLTDTFKPGPLYYSIEASNGDSRAPFIVMLDEMNLARVEHYFADVLDVMESRQKSAPYETIDDLHLVADANQGTVKLSRNGNTSDIPCHVKLPDNLFLVGTVNMDESTHGFSKKVLDRANTVQFLDVDLTLPDGTTFTAPPASSLSLLGAHLQNRPYRTLADVLAAYGPLAKDWNQNLESINQALKHANLHFGQRVRDEVLIYMANAQSLLEESRTTGLSLNGFSIERAFDYQIVQRILPRISGPREALAPLFNALDTFFEAHQEFSKSIEKLRTLKSMDYVSFWI